jgi:hypothetical protein
MKREFILSLGVAIGLGQSALAGEPAAPNPQSLGMVEALLSKCAAIDPAHADRYHEGARAVTQGAGMESVEKARKTDEYKRAYNSASESLDALAPADAVKTCRDSLGERQ